MGNLLEETMKALSDSGKTEDDVIWCGSEAFGSFPFGRFKELANKYYDDGYGSPKVCQDLLIVGDGWWLERYEYDGAEEWDYKTTPTQPEEKNPVVIVDNDFMWVTLKEANRPGGKYSEEQPS